MTRMRAKTSRPQGKKRSQDEKRRLGRPPRYLPGTKRPNFTVRLIDACYQMLRQAAAERGRSVSEEAELRLYASFGLSFEDGRLIASAAGTGKRRSSAKAGADAVSQEELILEFEASVERAVRKVFTEFLPPQEAA